MAKIKNTTQSAPGVLPQRKPEDLPADVEAIRKSIKTFLDSLDAGGKPVGGAQWGVYAFYDYDGEPIYIGQTYEGLRARISRHLTNRRTDAVAMNVLDPFEVADIAVWPMDLKHLSKEEAKRHLDQAEYTLYVKVIEESSFKAVLNEKPPQQMMAIELPQCYRGRIIPDNIYPLRKHPDVRIARRASTIAALARIISERKVTKYLRTTLLTQAKRLERLAAERLAELAGVSEDADVESDD
jgi:GIY-YIG catalytic domain